MKNLFIIAVLIGLVYWFKKSKAEQADTTTAEPSLKSAFLLTGSVDSPLANSNPTADGSGSGTSDAGTSTTTSGTRPNSTITGTSSGTTSGTSGGSGARRLTTISAFTWNSKPKSAFR